MKNITTNSSYHLITNKRTDGRKSNVIYVGAKTDFTPPNLIEFQQIIDSDFIDRVRKKKLVVNIFSIKGFSSNSFKNKLYTEEDPICYTTRLDH